MDAPEAAPVRRIIAGYIVLGVLCVAVVATALAAGASGSAQVSVEGGYTVATGGCLGPAGAAVTIRQSGRYVSLRDGAGTAQLESDAGAVSGSVICSSGETAAVQMTVQPDRSLQGTAGGAPVRLGFAHALTSTGGAAVTAPRSSEETFGRLALAVAVVIVVARLLGAAAARVGQPRVMGEVIAGVLLGPTLLGALLPGVTSYLFPGDITPLLSGAADIGLAFFMFLVGLELDLSLIRGRVLQAAFISNASVAVPMAAGIAVAVPLYGVLAPPAAFVPFALFSGVAMSITAFPVLARILVEKRMVRRPIGVLALGAAAVDDVSAWGLLALASATATAASGTRALLVIGLAALFCAAMALIARPLLARVATAFAESGHIPEGWIGVIFAGILLSAYVTQSFGVASIFGAFVMGLVMPRHASLSAALSRQIESFVVAVLLPLFFVVVGLKTDVGLLDRPALWLVGLGLLGVAIAGKFGGAWLASRLSGLRARPALALATLMNTRGLTELIVLNIGLELGVISHALFAILVLMALVTTLMAGPMLRLIDPRGEMGAQPEESLAEASAAPAPETRSILIAVQNRAALGALLATARPLATADRELVVIELLRPHRLAGIAGETASLESATQELRRAAAGLRETGIAVRTVAFTSPDSGADITRMARSANVDLVLLEGRRPLLGGGVPTGAVGAVLNGAPCDVAVLVSSDGAAPAPDAAHPVVVPFGGAEHDWSALELGALLAGAASAPLVLLGVEAGEGDRDPSRLLADASLVVQRFAGVTATPRLSRPGRQGIVEAASGAGLLVVGLSERWRSEGLGELRAALAGSGVAPTLFVRRGERPGALATPDSGTRFAWSTVLPA